MTRLPDWDRRLALVTEKHMRLPGEWGVSDCWMASMDAYEAVTGERLLPRLQRYKTEAGGYRAFQRAGFETVEDALASALVPVDGPLLAQRGDLATIERGGLISCGFITDQGLAVKTLYGEGKAITRAALEIHPVTAIRCAFKVGR